jgi:hypothetical protein
LPLLKVLAHRVGPASAHSLRRQQQAHHVRAAAADASCHSVQRQLTSLGA